MLLLLCHLSAHLEFKSFGYSANKEGGGSVFAFVIIII